MAAIDTPAVPAITNPMTEPEANEPAIPEGAPPPVAPSEPEPAPAATTPDAAAKTPDTPGTPDASDTLDLSRSKLADPPLADPASATGESEEPEPDVDETPVDLEALRRTAEALLFAAEAPLTVRELARAAGSRSHTIRKVLKALKESLDNERRPWELLEVAGGWRFATRPEFFPAIQKLKVQRSQRRLTPAAMEVLALIAYSQEPIGRAEIEAVRGVDSGPVLRQLLERKMIRIAGRGQGLGQPLLYAVSQEFLEHFGLKSAKDLPQPGEFKG